jgi:hypothetical protein
MDPVSIIVTALATGAAAGLKPTTEKAVRDSYAAIKALIRRKYSGVSVDLLENDPASEARRQVLAEDLRKSEAAGDEELLGQARAVLEAVERYAPDAAMAVGVKLERIKGASLTISDIEASGSGVEATEVEIAGDIKISKVSAGVRGRDRPNH